VLHRLKTQTKMWRKVLITLTIAAFIGLWIIQLDPVLSMMHRVAFLGAIQGVWLGLLLLAWGRKTLRFVCLAIPVLSAIPFLLPGRPIQANELRAEYVKGMKQLVGTKYVWGGESSLGIDCSGLPRKALRDALLSYGFRHLNGGALRMFAQHWWYDASANALAQGYRNYTMPLEPHGTIQQMDYSGLLPGDLAVTARGVHILAYIGDDQWIQADPGIGVVAILSGHNDKNRWFEVQVTTYCWSVMPHALK